MKIGIIVYSTTGHTAKAAEQLQVQLSKAGLKSEIERVIIDGEAVPGKFKITYQPQPADYDALVFAAPVQAFSLNPVMKNYLNLVPELKGKSSVYLTTKQLPFNWTGGNRTIRAMRHACEKKGARTLGSAILVWREDAQNASVNEKEISRLAGLFSKSSQ